MNEQNLEAIMGLIIHGGDAKSSAMEALQAAKEGDFAIADEKIKQAETAVSVNLKVSHLVNSKLSHLRYNKPYI